MGSHLYMDTRTGHSQTAKGIASSYPTVHTQPSPSLPPQGTAHTPDPHPQTSESGAGPEGFSAEPGAPVPRCNSSVCDNSCASRITKQPKMPQPIIATHANQTLHSDLALATIMRHLPESFRAAAGTRPPVLDIRAKTHQPAAHARMARPHQGGARLTQHWQLTHASFTAYRSSQQGMTCRGSLDPHADGLELLDDALGLSAPCSNIQCAI